MSGRKGKKRIAVVIPKYGLVGGAERFASELTERLAGNPAYDIHVFANKWQNGSNLITFHRIPIIRFPKFLTTISFAFFANQKIGSMDFDLIHTHERIFHAHLFTMHGIPHEIWVKEVREKPMSLFDYGTRWVERGLVKDMQHGKFLAVSGLTREKFLQAYPVDPERLRVIHPGVDGARFNTLDANKYRRDIRTRFGVDDRDIVVLFVGMNFEIKGLDTLMAAVALAKSKCPSARLKLAVVGKGNEKKYTRLAKELGILDDVFFAGVWEKNIEKLYLAGDIFSMFSKFDTFGMTVLEALSASLPVLISDNVGAKDLVQEGINGFVINKDDIETISSKLILMLSQERRKTMAKKAYETGAANSWDRVAEKMSDIYEMHLSARTDAESRAHTL